MQKNAWQVPTWPVWPANLALGHFLDEDSSQHAPNRGALLITSQRYSQNFQPQTQASGNNRGKQKEQLGAERALEISTVTCIARVFL